MFEDVDIKVEDRVMSLEKDPSSGTSFDDVASSMKVKSEFMSEVDHEINDVSIASNFFQVTESETREIKTELSDTPLEDAASVGKQRNHQDMSCFVDCDTTLKKEVVEDEKEIAQASLSSHSVVLSENQAEPENGNRVFLTATIREEIDERFGIKLNPKPNVTRVPSCSEITLIENSAACNAGDFQRSKINSTCVRTRNVSTVRESLSQENCSLGNIHLNEEHVSSVTLPLFEHGSLSVQRNQHSSDDSSKIEQRMHSCSVKQQASDALAMLCKAKRRSDAFKNPGPFVCKLCDATFTTKSSLKVHSVQHANQRPFFCAQCGSNFIYKSHLAQHVKIHSNERPLSCSFCAATFKRKTQLTEHLLIHTNEKPFACQYCDAKFKTRPGLVSHSVAHVMKKAFACTQCSATFESKFRLNCHAVAHSTAFAAKDRPFTCAQCSMKFRTKGNLKEHSVIHSNEKRFTCAQCGAAFKTKSCVKQHLRVHSSERRFACAQCDKTFKSKDGLRKHLAVHSGEILSCAHCAVTKNKCRLHAHAHVPSSQKPFKCLQCPAEVRTEECHKNHECCSNQKFSCSLCTATFYCKRYLDVHLKRVHSSGKPFSCKICGASFKTKVMLSEHLHVHIRYKPFLCSYCFATFEMRHQRDEHLAVHGVQGSHKCDVCPSVFISKFSLSHHSAIHENEKFTCPHCHLQYKSKLAFKSHLTVHLNEKLFSCEECSSTLKLDSLLREQPTDRSVKPSFKCAHCGAKFKSELAYRLHSAIHLKEKLCRSCALYIRNSRN